MAGTLVCSITTPEKLVFEGDAASIVVPASDGELAFYPKHAPLVGTLGHGELRVTEPGGAKKRFYVGGGFVQIVDDRVTILAVEAESTDSLDAAAEKSAYDQLKGSRPGVGQPIEEMDAYMDRLQIAKVRAKLAAS